MIYPKQVLLIPPKKGPTQLNKAQDSRKKKPATTEEVEAIEADQKPAEESESGDVDNKKKAETMTPPTTEDESAENDEITPEEENEGEEENPENLQ